MGTYLTFQKNSPGSIKDTVVDPVDPTNERTFHITESVQRQRKHSHVTYPTASCPSCKQ